MDYVINSKVIEVAKGGNKYTSDLLMLFAGNVIPHKVVKNIRILDEYKALADDYIRTWIELVTNNGYWVNVECDDDPVFIKTCLATHDKKLIVDDKNSDYADYEGLMPIDKDEAIDEISPEKNVIHQNGNNNQAIIGGN